MKRGSLRGVWSAIGVLVLAAAAWATDLTVVVNLDYNKGFDRDIRQISDTLNLTGDTRAAGVVNIGTNATQIDLSNIEDPGYVLLRNHDTNSGNAARFSSDGTNWLVRCGSGRVALFELEGTNLWGQATVTNVNIEYRAYPE